MRRAAVTLAVRLALLLAAAGGAGCGPRTPGLDVRLDAVAELRGDAAGFARADAPRTFRFPEDHGPHDGFRTEWWYVTGHLDAAEGRRFGFQLTFFRVALAPGVPPRSADWAASHVHMAHFALTDARAGRFVHHERFAREAAGLAGARLHPFAVWLEDWSLQGPPGGGVFPLRLQALAGDEALELVLDEGKPPVLQGDAGLSRKGPEKGNASYYYSLTRMPARGRVRAGGVWHEVSGHAWLDREWSTSALPEGVAGWDWFALQLDDGRELMFYRLRRADGGTDALSRGSLVAADGTYRVLDAPLVEARPEGEWRSARSGAAYPARWRLAVPSAGLDLTLVPLLADQELAGAVVYWEGAVDVSGSASGRGYVEMTGYESGAAPIGR